MNHQPGHERPGDTVPHQDEIEELIEEQSPGAGIRCLGPFPFDYQSPEIAGDGFALVDLPVGTVVLRAFVIQLADFGGSGSSNPQTSMYLAVGQRDSWTDDFLTVTRYGAGAGNDFEPIQVDLPGRSSHSCSWRAPWDATLGVVVSNGSAILRGSAVAYVLVAP